MSFILDQLKKSGKKRELELAMRSKAGTQGGEPAGVSLTDFQPASGAGVHMRGSYLLLFLAVVFISALGAFILFRGQTGNIQASLVSTKALVQTAGPSLPWTESAGQESVLPADRGTSMPPESRSKADPEKAVPAPAAVNKMPEVKIKSSMPVAVSGLRNQPVNAVQGQTVVLSPPEKSGPQDDLRSTPYINELSASQKNALPPIRITSHLYRGDSRLVSINGRIMSEGVSMDDGLFLEEITPEGVILSFRSYRFRVRAD